MQQIKISDETYEKIKDQLLEDEKKEITSYKDMIGGKWFFRTVTHYVLGRVTKQIGPFFELEEGSWIPDTGRLTNFLKNGELDEVEPTGQHYINIESVVDFFRYEYDLPKKQQ